MYFWNIKKLKQDLVEQLLSESDLFKYCFAYIILTSVGLIPALDTNMWDIYSGIIGAIITIIGTYYVYMCNKGHNGNNFLQKYFTVSWVLAIRWFIMFLIPTMIIYGIIGAIYGSISETTTMLDVVIFNIILIPYYWNLGKHIKDIA